MNNLKQIKNTKESITIKSDKLSTLHESATKPKPTSYMDATGAIDYGITNDYMFRALLQKNNRVLKGLICSLLHLKPEEVSSITITNPIKLSENIETKEFILDVNVMLNNNTQINLEMQVNNLWNWTDRSLSYLCRSYDQLYRGQNYNEALPVIHIGFLNYTLFPDSKEFYATYKLLNVKNYRIYSDKFMLSVVDLTQIDLATEEDKAFQIDYWARLFKATTWEEIKMIAQQNEYMSDASQTLYELNADEIVRQKCRAQEEYQKLQNSINKKMTELTEERDMLAEEVESLRARLAQYEEV